MTAQTVRLDLDLCRRRTRWTMAVSTVVHALIFLWLTTIKSAVAELPQITEITLLEPGDLSPAAPAAPSSAAAPAPQEAQGHSATSQTDVRFRRMTDKSDFTVEPQADWALADRMNTRLAALQDQERPLVVGTASTKTPASLFGSPATVPGPGGTGTAPVKLSRGEGLGGATSLTLSRGGTPGAPASLAPATVGGGKSEASAPAKPGDATARRTIAGVSLMGPVADRPVLFYSLPTYPEWAKQEAVEGSVTLYFVVRPDGAVKENVMVQKTAGFGDFDENARVALRGWRFEPLKGGRTGEQWGTITFHFRLRSAG